MPSAKLTYRCARETTIVFAATFCLACQPGDIEGGQDSSTSQEASADGDAGSPVSDGDHEQPDPPGDDSDHDAGSEVPGGGDGDRDSDASTPGGLFGRSGPSAGCGTGAPGEDSASGWTLHDIMVSGVAERFLEGHEDYGNQNGFDFAHRNYFVRLPGNYDNGKPYPLLISAGGCGTTDGKSGDGGGANPLSGDQDVAVQVGLSYVYTSHSGACFEDGSSDTPDLPYFDAVLAELDARYCFDRGKVFVSGFSSGAWESYMLACARGGVIRGIGTQAGGLRDQRPACTGVPVAAFLTAGVNDANPIEDIDPNTGFDHGSQAARDVILATNGCATKDSAPYVTADAPADWNCVSYTSCPKEYPVIWCAITADEGRHGAGSPRAFFPFWSMLPSE
jgi:polyhydroxybutyrate depolymerase